MPSGIPAPDSRRRRTASQERIHPEQGRQQQDAAIAILDIGGVNDGVQQQTQRIDENMALLALDLLARIIAMRIDAGPPFSALLTLWLSMMAGGRAGFAPALLAALHIKRVMDAIENALVGPEIEITVDCSFGGQIFGKITPLTELAPVV